MKNLLRLIIWIMLTAYMYVLDLPLALSTSALPFWLIIIFIGASCIAYIWLTIHLLKPVISAMLDKIKRAIDSIGY